MTVDAVAKSRWGKEDRVYFGPRPVDSGTQASPRRPPRDSQFASLSHCNLRFIIGLGLVLLLRPCPQLDPNQGPVDVGGEHGTIDTVPSNFIPLHFPPPKEKKQKPLTRNVPSANGLTGNWAKAVNNSR